MYEMLADQLRVAALILIRDSKYRRNLTADPVIEPVIRVPVESWQALLATIVGGNDDFATDAPLIIYHPDDSVSLSFGGTTLTYTDAEWAAFVAGVQACEFAYTSVDAS